MIKFIFCHSGKTEFNILQLLGQMKSLLSFANICKTKVQEMDCCSKNHTTLGKNCISRDTMPICIFWYREETPAQFKHSSFQSASAYSHRRGKYGQYYYTHSKEKKISIYQDLMDEIESPYRF